jgi:alpha/beta hydrolase fold
MAFRQPADCRSGSGYRVADSAKIEPNMTLLTAPDGVRLHYEIAGDGPPLILHLGAGCDSQLWGAAGYLEPLERSYRCVLFDHRGHGQCDRPRGAEANHVNRYVADVVALLDQLGVERAAFWGYSNAGTPHDFTRICQTGVAGLEQLTQPSPLATG